METNLFDALLELSNDFVFLLDEQRRVLKASQSVYSKLGYNSEDVIGTSIEMLYPENCRKQAQLDLLEMLDGNTDISTQPLINKQNQRIAVITRVRTCGAHTLEISTPLSSIKDIENRFFQIFKSNHALMAISEIETGVFIAVNNKFAEALHSTTEELIGHSSQELGLFSKEQREKIYGNILRDGYVQDLDVEIRNEYGHVYGSFYAEILEWDGRKVLLSTLIDKTEQIVVTKALQSSHEKYSNLVELLPEMICEVNLEGQIIYANKYSLHCFGYTEKDIVDGLSVLQIIAPQDRGRLIENLEKLKSREFNAPNEYKAIKKNGELFDSLVYTSRIEDHGEFVGIRGVMLDISQQKQAAENLRRSEERLELALHCADQGLWDWNIQTGDVYFSERWASMLGYTLAELEPTIKTWETLIHPQDKHRVLEALNMHLVGLSPIYSNEHRVKTKYGDWLWIQDTGRVVEWDSMKRPLRAVGTHINVDEQKRAKLFLQNYLEQQELVSKILLTIDAITEFDSKIKHILQLSAQHIKAGRVCILEYDITGISMSVTHEWHNTEHPSYQQEMQHIPLAIIPALLNNLETKSKLVCGDVHQLSSDLQRFLRPLSIESLIAFPLLISNCKQGVVVYCFKEPNSFVKNEDELIQTISNILATTFERRNVERWLRNAKIEADNANRAKSEFLANMSHEIRTPLNAVLGISEALAQRVTDEYMRNKLQTINSSGKTLLSLINDILDLSRIEAGRLEISPTPLSLSDITREVSTIFLQRAKEKGIDLQYRIDKSVPSVVELDETRIRQLLFNLIGNAVKFTDNGNVQITIEATSNGNGCLNIQIQVSDTGIGIPLDQQNIIFDAFRQQHGQDSRKYGGTGLGLAITKKIVELMNGEILVSSRPMQGSVFTIHLFNVSESESSAKIVTSQNFELYSFHEATVLVIDDIPINIETIELLNQSPHIQIIAKTSSKDALEWLKSHKPSLILCDIRMPDPDGWQMSQIIKTHQEWKNIPLIAYTASGTVQEQQRIAKMFDGLLLKPANQATLFGVFKQFLPHNERITTKTINYETLIEETRATNKKYIDQIKNLCDRSEIFSYDFIDIAQMEHFARQFKQITDDLHIEIMQTFANQFVLHCETFDLEKIEQTKKLITVLIE